MCYSLGSDIGPSELIVFNRATMYEAGKTSPGPLGYGIRFSTWKFLQILDMKCFN